MCRAWGPAPACRAVAPRQHLMQSPAASSAAAVFAKVLAAACAMQRRRVFPLTALRMALGCGALSLPFESMSALLRKGHAVWSAQWPWRTWKLASKTLEPMLPTQLGALRACHLLWQVGDVDQTPRTHATAALKNSGMRWCQSSLLGPTLAAIDPGKGLPGFLPKDSASCWTSQE